MIAVFDKIHPIRISRTDHIFGVGGMSCQTNTKAGVALLMKILPHPAHFFGRAGESMNKQTGWFGRVALKQERLGGWNDLRHRRIILSFRRVERGHCARRVEILRNDFSVAAPSLREGQGSFEMTNLAISSSTRGEAMQLFCMSGNS